MLSFAIAASIAATPVHAEVLRHALVVGSNDGGAGLEPLRYAEDDARRFAGVLVELGGFASADVTVLAAPTPAALDQAIASHAWRSGDADEDLFLFYYSGHADAHGLRLGTERVPFADLKERIRSVPAEVTLGVLDACRSGEITRLKGMEIAAPFAEEDGLESEGEIWLAATSAAESAQESDSLRGSFFTHYLVSALRGAADRGDGIVSLGEAYAYAYERTVSRTGGTAGGTQHPVYDFQLQGKGDLPLTDVRRASARVTLAPELAGIVTVLRLPDRTPVAEVAKTPGEKLGVALEPGRYALVLRDGNRTAEATIGLSAGSDLPVRSFAPAPVELAMAKGAPPAGPMPDELARAGQRLRETIALDEIDLRHSPVVAGGASALLPGAGQFYNRQWWKGGAFLASSWALTGSAIALSEHGMVMTARGPVQTGWGGTMLGSSPAGLMAAMVWGWSIADASSTTRASSTRATRSPVGWTLSYGTAWSGEEIPSSGLCADWLVQPGFSLGLDRTGWVTRPDETWEMTTGGRAMLGVESPRWRPALVLALGFAGGPPAAGEVSIRPVVGAGGNVRWYATTKYFLEVETRAELESGDVRGTLGGALGMQFGR